MKDLIDERNFREKCARSIVKGYNVRYIMPEEAEETKEPETDAPEEPAAQSVLDDESRWAHIPSAGYGKMKDNDPVTEEQIRKILGERNGNPFEAVAEEM